MIDRTRWAWIRRGLVLTAAGVALGLTVNSASAQDFFRGKQIKLVVGSGTGGGYDTNARLLARHWADHIPGHPDVIVQNMPGAGSLKAMNYLANVAPKDGLTVGGVQNSIGYEPMMGISGGKENAHFDPLKMNWIGSMSKEVAVTVFWNPSPVHSIDDLRHTTVKTGSSGASTSNTIYAELMNAILGTKFNVVEGYKGQTEVWLAMERGEIQGSAGPFYSSLRNSKSAWLKEGKLTIVDQIGLEKHPDLPNVPLILDFAKNDQERQAIELAVASLTMGRPYVLPSGVAPDRVKTLQVSFMATMKGPKLLAEAEKLKLEIDPIDGEAVHALLVKMYNTPRPIIDKVTAIFVPKRK